jgi:hypothetical protein
MLRGTEKQRVYEKGKETDRLREGQRNSEATRRTKEQRG